MARMVSSYLRASSTTSSGEHSCRPIALCNPSMDRISSGKRGDERTNTSVRRTTTGFGEIVMVEYKGELLTDNVSLEGLRGKRQHIFLVSLCHWQPLSLASKNASKHSR